MGFEKLRVYELAEQLGDAVWDAVCGWQSLARDTVGKQIDALKPLMDELSPKLNAYLKSIGPPGNQ